MKVEKSGLPGWISSGEPALLNENNCVERRVARNTPLFCLVKWEVYTDVN